MSDFSCAQADTMASAAPRTGGSIFMRSRTIRRD